MVDLDIKWLLSVLIAPASIAVFLWLTRVYLPARQKQEDDTSAHKRKQSDIAQQFGEGIQGDAVQHILANQRDLIKHLIESNNGHLSGLTEAVSIGADAHTVELKQVTAAINKLLVLMSRQQADQSIPRGIEPWEDVDPILAATIKSPAVKKVDAVVAAAVNGEAIEAHEPEPEPSVPVVESFTEKKEPE